METTKTRGRLATMLTLGTAFLLFVALSGNTAGDCMPIEPENLCEADADCADLALPGVEGRWECVNGVCELFDDILPPEGCQSDAECRPGQRCEIDYDADCCPPGALCWMDMPVCEGVCVPDFDPNECWSDEDCRPGQVCQLMCTGACPPNEPCPEPACFGQCVPDPDPRECWEDADCAPGQVCQIDPDDCPPCLPGEECLDMYMVCFGHCVPGPDPSECRSDADCRPGERCEEICLAWDCADPAGMDCLPPPPECFGQCVPDPEPICYEDSDCRPNELCVIDWDQCWREGELPCAPGERCGEPCPGHCEPRTDPNECRTDADCGPGELCLMACAEPICLEDEGWPCPPPECFGQCVPDPNPNDCGADWDCAADERCEIDWDGCGWWDCDDPEGFDCGPCLGQCVPIKECLSHSDCPGGTYCDYGMWGCGEPMPCEDGDMDCTTLPCMGVCTEGPSGYMP